MREGQHHWGTRGGVCTNILNYAGTIPARGVRKLTDMNCRFADLLYLSLCDFELYTSIERMVWKSICDRVWEGGYLNKTYKPSTNLLAETPKY